MINVFFLEKNIVETTETATATINHIQMRLLNTTIKGTQIKPLLTSLSVNKYLACFTTRFAYVMCLNINGTMVEGNVFIPKNYLKLFNTYSYKTLPKGRLDCLQIRKIDVPI